MNSAPMFQAAIVALALTGCGQGPAVSEPAAKTAAALPRTSDAAMTALLKTYCLECHSGPRPHGGIGLDTLAGASAAATKAIREIEGGNMPPKRAQQPTESDRAAMLSWFSAQPASSRPTSPATAGL